MKKIITHSKLDNVDPFYPFTYSLVWCDGCEAGVQVSLLAALAPEPRVARMEHHQVGPGTEGGGASRLINSFIGLESPV